MSVWEKQEANRKKLLEACKREVGEELPMKPPTEKKEKKTCYPVNNKWFRLKNRMVKK